MGELESAAHIMLDLETLGTSVNAPIVQIGACYFDPREGTVGKEFLVNVDFASALEYGTPDGATVAWWMQQSEAARRSITESPVPMPLPEALRAFANHFYTRSAWVWSHATFDATILLQAYRRTGVSSPISYRRCMDLRTLNFVARLLNLTPHEVLREGVHHNALDDARYQSAWASQYLREIIDHRIVPITAFKERTES